MIRVLIGIISMSDFVHVDFVRSILHLDTEDLEVDHFFCGHSITSAARNTCAAKAMGEGYDYLFFADSDMSLHPGTLKRLLTHEVDIASGCYRARRGDASSPFFAFNFDAQGVPYTINEIDISEGSPELIEVQGLPTGCLLIKTDVFNKLDDVARSQGYTGKNPGQPYFFYAPRLDRLIFDREKRMFEESAGKRFLDADITRLQCGFGIGEDLQFCKSCVEAGIKLYLDTRLVAGHLATKSMGTPAIYA